VRRIRSLLRSALDVVEEGDEGEEAGGGSEEQQEAWPRHEDTREFEAPQRPSLFLSSEPRDANSA
jgi:hypothetical protein